MEGSNIKLSIIIVSYNTSSLTCQCLRSIYSATWDFNYEIILVDNASKDDTLECVRREFSNVKIIENSENKLFAIANNQGAAIANGEYLLLLNSDTIVESDNLSKLIHYHEGLPEKVVCIGPKVLNSDGSIQSQGRELGCMGRLSLNLLLHRLLPDFFVRKFLPLGLPLRRPIARKVGWVCGACMSIRKSYYCSTGGLNEQLLFYGEEPEFSWRAYKNKKETWYYPDASIIHLGGVSTDKDWADAIWFNAKLKQIRFTSGVPAVILEELLLLLINSFKLLFTFRKKYCIELKRRIKMIRLYVRSLISEK